MKLFSIDFLVILALIGVIPVIVLLLQFLLVGLHGLYNHYPECRIITPRVAIIIPVWNEEDVIGDSIERLMGMNYPSDCLRLYVVDDASNDRTPEIIKGKVAIYPDNIVYLRREVGGLGKAYVLNHGLKSILSDSWAEAIMIVDADVLFENDTLSRMTRHFADPQVGAVTAYIREGKLPGNLITHLIAFEYIVAQAASRRAQNVMGVLACLAGGAQLHTRANIEALGGLIDTSTLAEDTYTTFKTQMQDYHVVFDGNAIAISEEPGEIVALWKQRFRWARGNIQITRAFRRLWFHGKKVSNLGGIFFSLVWFCTLMMPFVMIVTSFALISLFFLEQSLSWSLLRAFSVASAVSYIFTTVFAFIIDPLTSKRSWFAGLVFPGIISLMVMAISIAPNHAEQLLRESTTPDNFIFWRNGILLAMDAWVCLAMVFAWLIYRLDRLGAPQKLTNFLLIMVGYGPLLCAITMAAFIAETTKMEMKWDKTEKLGETQQKIILRNENLSFEEILKKDIRAEYRLFYYELILISVIGLLIALRYYYKL